MLWWHWIVVGFILIGIELGAVGNFFFLFFGLGAILVGLLDLVGLEGPQWLQWLLFSFFSVVLLMLFRDRLLQWFHDRSAGADRVDALTGETAVVLEPLAPSGMGRVELRGAAWSARNLSTARMAKGERCRVVAVDGLVLSVQPLGGD